MRNVTSIAEILAAGSAELESLSAAIVVAEVTPAEALERARINYDMLVMLPEHRAINDLVDRYEELIVRCAN